MSGKLLNIIKEKIRAEGPMDLGAYMELCLGHPEHGYYMVRDPFGAEGDFTTAPEVSQLFGEMIGAWMADLWIKMGSPAEFILLECGPGRGTLMADIMRSTKHVSGFHDAARIYLMEMSPVLRGIQQQKLEIYDPRWIDDLSHLPATSPVLLVANEFLDALPIRHIAFRNGGWVEVVVTLENNDTLGCGQKEAPAELLEVIPARILEEAAAEVFEVSPAINQYLKSVDILLIKQGGAALFLDYGHVVSAMGDTLQAVRSHRFVSPFENPGDNDITAHVDFENVGRIAREGGLTVHGPVTQGTFLQSLGIGSRAERLWAGANEVQRDSLMTGLERLIDTEQMGSLFKVIALCHDPLLQPEGFHEDL